MGQVAAEASLSFDSYFVLAFLFFLQDGAAASASTRHCCQPQHAEDGAEGGFNRGDEGYHHAGSGLPSSVRHCRGDRHVALQGWPSVPVAALHVHLAAPCPWSPLDPLVGAQLGLPEDVYA